MIASKILSIPNPLFALASIISLFSHPTSSIICCLTSSVWAEGKSTLLITGIIVKSFSIAK